MSVASKRTPRSSSMAVAPSAARLTNSLRDIGYDFQSAVADVIDNSIAAGAQRISVEISFDGPDSTVTVADDGTGLSANGIMEALRFGSRRDYERGQLGRYGLGLKTASLSQGRAVTVASRRGGVGRVAIRSLDLDVIEEWDDWLVIEPTSSAVVERCSKVLDEGFSTVVLWEKLDRLLPYERPEGGWAKRRVESSIVKCSQHLSMVFHRFLEREDPIVIEVNGTKLSPWDPFAREEPRTQRLPSLRFEVDSQGMQGLVELDRYVLPARTSFSSQQAFESLSGPLRWNRQQGIYIYRADRLVQWGGWAGIRGIDEHTKLARVALSFNTELDELFNTNVAKMRVAIPSAVRQQLAPAITEACLTASEAYRRAARQSEGQDDAHDGRLPAPGIVKFAITAAAMQTGDTDALDRITAQLHKTNPELAQAIGL